MSAYTWSTTSAQFAGFTVANGVLRRFIAGTLEFAALQITYAQSINVSGQSLNEFVKLYSFFC